MTTIEEKYKSRSTETGDSASAEYVYTVMGSDDPVTIETDVLAAAPATVATATTSLIRLGMSIRQVSNGHWEAFVNYGHPSLPPFPETGESSYQFEVGGGTQRRTHALENIANYGIGAATPPDFKGAIGVTENGVEGVDVIVPQFQFSETHYIDDLGMTPTYQATIATLAGGVNDATFKGHAAGEVLFLGASGGKRGAGDWEVNFRFGVQRNVTGLQVGDITGIDKDGWDYLWFRFAEAESGNALVKRPQSAHVDRVYPRVDLSQLGL